MALFILALATRALATPVTILDDFEQAEGWTATASEGAQVWLAQEPGHSGRALRIDYDFGNGSGYVIVRKALPLTLPANFAFTFWLLGEGVRNNFEFKLVDPTARTVWWWRQRDFAWPTEWQQITVRKSRLELAWSATPKPKLQKVAAIEFAIAAGEGGSGSVWIDDLAFEERPTPAAEVAPPAVEASSTLPGFAPAGVLDGAGWRSEPTPPEQWLLFDFGEAREFGGLVVDWDPDDYATAFDVETSSDGERWTVVHSSELGDGARDYLYLPDQESRFLRLNLRAGSRGQGYGIRALRVKPIGFSASPNHFFEEIAREEPAGAFPKYLLGRQTYWTVVGVEGDSRKALLNEEGQIEVDRSSFSLEPFLWFDDRLVTWADVTCTQSLAEDYLPIPSVTWTHDAFSLATTALASGTPGSSLLLARYRLENRRGERLRGRLLIAIRPFQVLPPWQALNMVGGVSPIQQIRWDEKVVRVDREKVIVPLTPPAAFGATTLEETGGGQVLRGGKVPERTAVSDPSGFATGVLAWDVDLAPRETTEVILAVPFHEPFVEALAAVAPADAQKFAAAEQHTVARRWETLLRRVEIDLPPPADRFVRIMRTNLAYALINRDGPKIQPGPRTYARAWIRDGATTSAAFLQMGSPAEVRDFLRWYATQQFSDGRIPCCIDRRGPDPTFEHDSTGQFIWLVAEYYRYTRDIGLVADLWPNVSRALDYLATLRAKRTTDLWRGPAKIAYFGLLPESISHEGYSSHPVHAYWDDFWALAALRAAPQLAMVAGDFERADTAATLRDDFEATLAASIQATMTAHGIDYVPGSVELGDFDPTSTAIAITTAGGVEGLEPVFRRTLDRYLAEVDARRRGENQAEAYSPYELRNVDALVRLGRRDEALALLEWLVADQRPPAWHEWAEVSWRDRDAPHFIGDMPHTWIGSIYVRTLRAMLAYERDTDRALVIGAGVPAAWVASERGVSVRRLPTYYGVLGYQFRAEDADSVRLRLGGDLAVPPGGIVVVSPFARPITAVTVNGHTVATHTADTVTVHEVPADVLLRYDPVEPPVSQADGRG